MHYDNFYYQKLYQQQLEERVHQLDPDKIIVPWGYRIEVFAIGLDNPISIVFTEEGDLLYADSGVVTGNPKVVRIHNQTFTVVAEGFRSPISGINYRNGNIYVSHRGFITIVQPDGTKRDIIRGLHSSGDYINNRIEFGEDGKLYFGQGTVTNSGIVGLDNKWVFESPFLHDNAGSYVLLNPVNYRTKNIRVPSNGHTDTGPFSAFGIAVQEHEVVKGMVFASGSVMRANMDGSNIEMLAWGFRNPMVVKFDRRKRLLISNQSYEVRGSRPIANALDELYVFKPDAWYGWPDFNAGEPVNQFKFALEGGRPPELLLETIPSIPDKPFSTFAAGSGVMGFDFSYNEAFGMVGDLYMAEFGESVMVENMERTRSHAGHRVSKVNINTGEVTTFLMNKTGLSEPGGLSHPTDVAFGPDGAMYVADYSSANLEYPNVYLPNTGVIWRVTKDSD